MFDGSIKDNIAYPINNNNNEDDIINAAKQSQAHEFIEKLPNKYDTMIGERGQKLSVGQKQRIAIARALYHGRQVLIMDEATSALDDKTENEIIEQIRRLKGEMTLIVIAHRLTTLRYCNRIFEIVDGKISSQKSYEDIAV